MTLLKTLWKMWENRDIKLVTTERRNHLISEPDFHTTKFFKVINNRNKKNEILMNKLAYLGLSALESTEILIYEFWYDYT